MKKSLSVLVLAMVCLCSVMLSGCAPGTWSCAYNASYAPQSMQEDSKSFNLMTSHAELKEYVGADNMTAFTDYDEAFFEKKDLVFVHIPGQGEGKSVDLKNVSVNKDGVMTVTLKVVDDKRDYSFMPDGYVPEETKVLSVYFGTKKDPKVTGLKVEMK